MEAIVRTCIEEKWNAQIAAVISNRPNAGGLAFAHAQGIKTAVVNHQSFANRTAFDQALADEIDQYSPDLVVLAGFMRILTSEFVEHYSGRLLNIHPSLLPAFPGLHTHESALTAGVKVHGATVHYVTAELDHGPIVIQAALPVLPEDSADSLAARLLTLEHQIYPRAVRWHLEQRLNIQAQRVTVTPTDSQLIWDTAL